MLPILGYASCPEEGAWADFDRRYEDALDAFERADFDQADVLLDAYLTEVPGDGAAALLDALLDARLAGAQTGLEPSFDPVWFLPGK